MSILLTARKIGLAGADEQAASSMSGAGQFTAAVDDHDDGLRLIEGGAPGGRSRRG